MKNVFPLDVNIGFEHGKSGCLSYINSNCGGVWSVALLQSRGGAAVSGGSVRKAGRAAGTNLCCPYFIRSLEPEGRAEEGVLSWREWG